MKRATIETIETISFNSFSNQVTGRKWHWEVIVDGELICRSSDFTSHQAAKQAETALRKTAFFAKSKFTARRA